jgi:hypothetical protein
VVDRYIKSGVIQRAPFCGFFGGIIGAITASFCARFIYIGGIFSAR